MYYDLVCSLPHLVHLERVRRLPITPQRLKERLRGLKPEHASKLNEAMMLLRWRPLSLSSTNDASWAESCEKFLNSCRIESLRSYVQYRITQQVLVAALRSKRDGLEWHDPPVFGGDLALEQKIRRRWNVSYFGLEYVYPWIPEVQTFLTEVKPLNLEKTLMNLNWKWLSNYAGAPTFKFDDVMAYVFKWDILRSWLAHDSERARIKFAEIANQVADVESTEQE
ncbi:hypothetical protein KOR42_15930 [Thalassoglobus neptunius]|uniref:Uncharacterized protein n=1 Tax=Thalassoglobus neptunius TaxID=1938619 RepID=A0A5C5X8M1_9PLAN|nr:DUF2764 family protein [Thalassoglobus neptunius]TWT58222.1 hypothetical protein KOR42_15930 [Thalassoglobus neptunius]